MKLPKGIDIEGVDNPSEWVLELKRNLYGGKDAGRNWYLYLKGKLESIGFVRSSFDECVFYRGNCMYVLYTDDSILAGPDQAELNWTRQSRMCKLLGWISQMKGLWQTFWESTSRKWMAVIISLNPNLLSPSSRTSVYKRGLPRRK